MDQTPAPLAPVSTGFVDRALRVIERLGNKLPDPAMLFVVAIAATAVLSALLSSVTFTSLDPRTGAPIVVHNLLTGPAIVAFLSGMVKAFTDFPPLGVVLVALLGVGVAEHAGLVTAMLKAMLAVTPTRFLTPMVIFAGILSHTAADAGFVLVIPLAGVMFAAAGRHPVAGIAAGFAGVSGGFSANVVPSGLDPLLQGFTQSAAQLIDPAVVVNPLCNWAFMASSSLIIVALGWFITDRIVEPRVAGLAIDTVAEAPTPLAPAERRALAAAALTVLALAALLLLSVWPSDSPLRAPDGSLSSYAAPIMRALVPFIFLVFLVPGLVYGVVAGTIRSHKDVVAGMTHAMSTMSYYLVLAFCAALFTDVFKTSNLGALLAIEGAAGLRALAVPGAATLAGAIGLTAAVNLLIGSASAKWALLAPILVPMLMQVGLSPELTQAAFRIGDSSTNIVTPLMPYFPLVVVYCQRHAKRTGIGTLLSLMIPYSVAFLTAWTALLMLFWALELPLGLQSGYVYPR